MPYSYEAFCPMELRNQEPVDGVIMSYRFDCDEGPHDPKDIMIKICNMKFVQPHEVVTYDWRPDEFTAGKVKADAFVAVTSSYDKLPCIRKIYWGTKNIISHPFVIARRWKGQLYPFIKIEHSQIVLSVMYEMDQLIREGDDGLGNLSKSKSKGKSDEKIYTNFDNIGDLIKHLGGSKNN